MGSKEDVVVVNSGKTFMVEKLRVGQEEEMTSYCAVVYSCRFVGMSLS